MPHAVSTPGAAPHRGSRRLAAPLLARREHQGPAALTRLKADSKRGSAYRYLESPAIHRFKEAHMRPLIFGQRLFSVFGPDPSHSEHGAVIRRRPMTGYPIRQCECSRIIEENHGE
jgi:hypothetical protein